MKRAPVPSNEAERLQRLHELDILDTLPEEAYDDLTAIAASICGTPISLVSLVDDTRQFFKSRHGITEVETPRDVSFCAHAILRPDELFIVEDARKDERFMDNPLVTESPKVVFYAGMPIVTKDGLPMGSLCVIDSEPRRLNDSQKLALKRLARQVSRVLDLRLSHIRLTALQKKSEEHALEMERFASSAAHDIKDPVQGIGSLMNLLETEFGEILPDEAKEYVQLASTSAQRLHQLVSDLLNFARLQRKNVPVSEIDLNVLLEEVHAHHQLVIRERKAEFTWENLPTVRGRKLELFQVFVNLVGNALKFTPPDAKPVIQVRVEQNTDTWLIAVQDNGLGIKKEYHEEIFGYFTRLHRQAEYEGSGLGLSLCKRIAEAHGGRIELSSEYTKGSTFTLVLPVNPVPN